MNAMVRKPRPAKRQRPRKTRAHSGEGRLIALALLVIVVAAASIGALLALQYRAADPVPPPRPSVAVAPVARMAPAAPTGKPSLLYEEPIEPAALPPLAPAARIVPPPALVPAPGGALPAWRRNAVALTGQPADGRPKIAVIIDDLGVDRERGARVQHLPAPLTMAFLPYAYDLPQQTMAARRAGHELLVHVPMDPRNRAITDPGPHALLVDLTADELRRRIDWNLSQFDGYVGINNHMGSRFTADADRLLVVMAALKQRGLLYLDSRTSAQSSGLAVARATGVPAVARDVFIDHVNEPDAVRRALAEVEQIARRNGHAIAIGHPRDATIEALAEWLPLLTQRGFRLVPLSALVQEQFPGG
jgi:hypothetical protein